MKFNNFLSLGLISLFSILFIADAGAQVNEEWVRTYLGPVNGGGINLMTVHNDFIYVSGQNAGSAVAYDIVTIKYNSVGDSLWVRRYGNGGESQVTGIITDNSDNLYVTGYTVVSGMPRSVLIKYGPTGNLLWAKLCESTPDTRSIGVGLDDAGNPYIAASSNLNGTDWGVEVVKYNAATGDEIWTGRYDQTVNSIDIPYAMTVDAAGNSYITGYSQDSGIIKAMLIKYDSNGNFQWDALYDITGVTGEIQGRAIKVDDAGNIYVAGHAYNGQATFVDFLVFKCNPNGEFDWVETYSNSNSIDEAYDLAVDNSGNVYATGKSYAGGGGSNNYDYLTVKFSNDGTPLWQAIYDGPAVHTEDEAHAIVLDTYGNCYVTGASSYSALFNSAEYATVKYDENGNQVWSIRHDNGAGAAIGIDSHCNIYAAGNLQASFATIKYSQPGFPPVLTNFTENFDGVTAPALPEGWTGLVDVLLTNTVAEVKTVQHGGAPSQPNAVFLMNGLDGSNGQRDTTAFVALVSPLVDFGNFGGSLTFFGTGNNPIDVGVMTDPSDASTFQLVEEVAITSDFTEYTVGIPNTGTGYIAFKHSNINSVQVLFVDQVSFAQVTPVELTSFTATVNENNEVVLNWGTSTETNNRGFEIQKSEVKDQKSEWEKIGFIAGSGTTTEPKTYTFTDNNVNSVKYSYRLKQIDYDGTYEYSNEVEAEVNMPMQYSLSQNYPNPFNPSTIINFTLPVNSEVTLKIYNALGEEIRTLIQGEMTSGIHEIDFRANDMVSGVYFYRLDAKGNDNTDYHSVKKMLLVK